MAVYYRAVCMYGNVPSDRRRCRSGAEAIFVRATWPEKPGFSGNTGNEPSLLQMALRSINDLHMPREAEILPSGCRSPMVEQEAPHSALTGADAARPDVTGRLLEPFRGTRAFPCAWSEFVSSGCDLFGQHLGDPWR